MDAPEETPVAIFYTSGTTARPKGVTHTQCSLGNTVGYYLQATGMQENDVVLGMLSMAHIFAYSLQLLSSLCAGATVLVMQGNDPKLALSLIARHRVSHLYGLPVMFNALIEAAFEMPIDASALRYCLGRGDAVSLALSENMRRAFGIDIHQACGMTEVIPYYMNRVSLETTVFLALSGGIALQIGSPADLSHLKASHFLLLRKKKVTKEKATRMPLISCATRFRRGLPKGAPAPSATPVESCGARRGIWEKKPP